MKREKTTRRAMMTSAIQGTAMLATASGAAAANTARPRPAGIPIKTIDIWDDTAEWVCAHQSVVCCTADERVELVASRPAMEQWQWVELGDRWVGISPSRPSANTRFGDNEAVAFLRRYAGRLDQVAARRARTA